ncbi:MAG: hypothetical protein HRT74_07145 [Flavobacteriales bacterium]|nr:hypothetical protein [Flavobacteriales bacterium]
MEKTDSDSFDDLLSEGEEVLLVVQPKKGIMFRTNDIVKAPFAIAFLIMAFMFTLESMILAPFMGILFLAIICYNLYLRYSNTNNIKYVITNIRVLFVKNGYLKRQKSFETTDKIRYVSRSKNRGYIVLGEEAPLFAGRGLNFEEEKYVLDNLTNFREVSRVLKSLN